MESAPLFYRHYFFNLTFVLVDIARAGYVCSSPKRFIQRSHSSLFNRHYLTFALVNVARVTWAPFPGLRACPLTVSLVNTARPWRPVEGGVREDTSGPLSEGRHASTQGERAAAIAAGGAWQRGRGPAAVGSNG